MFISKGGTGILFQILVSASQEPTVSEDLMVQLHSLLAKVGPNGESNAVRGIRETRVSLHFAFILVLFY